MDLEGALSDADQTLQLREWVILGLRLVLLWAQKLHTGSGFGKVRVPSGLNRLVLHQSLMVAPCRVIAKEQVILCWVPGEL